VNGNTDARFMRRRKTTAPVSSRPAKLQRFLPRSTRRDLSSSAAVFFDSSLGDGNHFRVALMSSSASKF
jgi:hypothetical protein